jgi:hypothetical protein
MSDSLRIAFYAPLKPLGHPHPSGDLVIGTGLYQFLQGRLGVGFSSSGLAAILCSAVVDWTLIFG